MSDHPGITVAELRDAFGVGKARARPIVAQLETGRIRRSVQVSGDPRGGLPEPVATQFREAARA